MDHQKDHPWTGVDHPVKETPQSAHMSRMSNPRKTLIALAAAALVLTSATGCSDGQRAAAVDVTPESRAAYEAARFGTPDGKIASSLALARLTAETKGDSAAAGGVANTLLNPKQWQAQAHTKLCEYTSTLMNNADRDGTAVSERTRAMAKQILDRC
jgi:hypothetical protein